MPAVRGLAIAALAAALLAQTACSSEDGQGDEEGLRVGALLSYTGERADTGANNERAIILAAERLNAGGGIAGRPIRIIYRDTHSSVERGLEAARSLIESEHVVALLGPDDDELAKRIVPLIREHAVAQISGGATSPSFSTMDDDGYWFRTIPSALPLGRGLAKRMYNDGKRRVATFYARNEYGANSSRLFEQAFVELGGQVVASIGLEPEASSYGVAIGAARAATPDALALFCHPATGAMLVRESSSQNFDASWYFSHTLRSQQFVTNVPPGSIEDAVGVAPTGWTESDTHRFVTSFAQRWDGDQPMIGALLYYDAMALVGLAAAQAAVDLGQLPTGDQIRDHVLRVAKDAGLEPSWSELDEALRLIRAQKPINYRGVSGTVDLDENGDVPLGLVEIWRVQGQAIVRDATLRTSY